MSEAERKAQEAATAEQQERARLDAMFAPKPHERIGMLANVGMAQVIRAAFTEGLALFNTVFTEEGKHNPHGHENMQLAYECGKRGMWALKTLLETYSSQEYQVPYRTDLPPEVMALHDSVGGIFAGVLIQLTHENIGKWVLHPDGYSGRIMGTGVANGNMNLIWVAWQDNPSDPAEHTLRWEFPDSFWQTYDTKPS